MWKANLRQGGIYHPQRPEEMPGTAASVQQQQHFQVHFRGLQPRCSKCCNQFNKDINEFTLTMIRDVGFWCKHLHQRECLGGKEGFIICPSAFVSVALPAHFLCWLQLHYLPISFVRLRCIRSDQFCNGVNDCDDNSDEDDAICQR